MHRLLALAVGVLAVIALVALLRRRRASPGALPPIADPRTAALRRKLAEVREPAEPEPEARGEAGADAARRSVHEEARAVIEEMERAGEP